MVNTGRSRVDEEGTVKDQAILFSFFLDEALGSEVQVGEKTLEPARENSDILVAFFFVKGFLSLGNVF